MYVFGHYPRGVLSQIYNKIRALQHNGSGLAQKGDNELSETHVLSGERFAQRDFT